MIRHNLVEIWNRKELLYQFFIRDLKVKYKSSVLGIFWSLLSPVLIMVIYTLVFSIIMRFKTSYPYPLFLLSVWLPWQFMQTTLIMTSTILIENGDLLNKIYFPRIFLPLSNLFTNLVNFFISMVLFFALRAVFMDLVPLAIFLFPVILLIQILFILGFSLLIATGTVFFRDLRYLLDIFLLLWFFGSPVIYGIEFVPDWLLPYYLLNPFTSMAISYRSILLSPVIDSHVFWTLLVSGIWAIGTLFIGLKIFYRFENAIIKEL